MFGTAHWGKEAPPPPATSGEGDGKPPVKQWLALPATDVSPTVAGETHPAAVCGEHMGEGDGGTYAAAWVRALALAWLDRAQLETSFAAAIAMAPALAVVVVVGVSAAEERQRAFVVAVVVAGVCSALVLGVNTAVPAVAPVSMVLLGEIGAALAVRTELPPPSSLACRDDPKGPAFAARNSLAAAAIGWCTAGSTVDD